MSYYFFHHPLKSRNGIPGRHRFSVEANLVSRNKHYGRQLVDVAVDSLGENEPGTNVDPCPFADPYALSHTFCGIDRQAGRYMVPGSDLLLSEVLRRGDTVIYGHLHTRGKAPISLCVDTVMVVSKVIELPLGPQVEGLRRWVHALDDAYAQVVLDDATASIDSLTATNLWKFNLSDAQPGRAHQYTGVNPHRMILADAEACSPNSLRSRRSSYVPLLAPNQVSPVQLTSARAPNVWPKLEELVAGVPRLCGSMKPPVALAMRLGEDIYDACIRWSGHGGVHEGCVAVPPLRWLP
jgi:hypothetical protein